MSTVVVEKWSREKENLLFILVFNGADAPLKRIKMMVGCAR